MGPRHCAQDVDLWLPFVGSLEQPVPATQAPAEQRLRWTVTQQTASPAGLLESVALLYGEAVADRHDEEGCAAFVPVIRWLEGAEVAPIPTVMQLLRRLLANTNQDGGHATQLGFLLGTWQVVCLVRLRWPETEDLADIERRCRERSENSPADFQFILDLVAGAGSDRELRAAFDGDQDAEIPPALSATPHKYCPDQGTLLVAPAATSRVWALDLRHCAIWLVDKDKGDFDDDGSYRLRGSQGREDLMVPSATSDLDFIFGHL
ncbi:hypothetical protein F5X98DRAFT_365394 [Xylaria grammica]|nr:hypothetical protein F5X98DRAFT_365394 [Xylaria grammica]